MLQRSTHHACVSQRTRKEKSWLTGEDGGGRARHQRWRRRGGGGKGGSGGGGSATATTAAGLAAAVVAEMAVVAAAARSQRGSENVRRLYASRLREPVQARGEKLADGATAKDWYGKDNRFKAVAPFC